MDVKTWFLTLREEHRLRLLECMVVRKILGAKKDKVTGKLRRPSALRTVLPNKYFSSDQIKKNKTGEGGSGTYGGTGEVDTGFW